MSDEPAPREHVRRELARGTTELAVLAALKGAECYGYELLKRLERPGSAAPEIREGTLYPLLHRLEDAGHIAASWHAEGRARPRKYYAITPKGEAYLELLRAEWDALVAAMDDLLAGLRSGGAGGTRDDT